jgi:hypothetical protein
VFDMNGDYYVAVPLDAPPRLNPTERENLRVEAQLLANLFASFEREKIFKRTLLPMTSSIQKRLRRQGSKFASSEAFRVYKFTNGAWSDIILGAIMGAARRAELNRNDERYDREPRLPLPAAAPADPSASMKPERTETRAAPAADRVNESATPTFAVDPEHAKRFGPYATAYQPETSPYFAPPQAPRVRRAPPPPAPEAEVTVRAANSNTVDAHSVAPPPLPETRPATVFTIPRTAHQRGATDEAAASAGLNERLASVTLQRETATFTVPVSEAVIPDELKAAFLAGGRAIKSVSAQRSEPVAIDRDTVQDIDFQDDEAPQAAQEPLSAEDRAFLRRIAPPAAE